MDGPRGKGQQFPLLILRGNGIRLLEPLFNRRILAVDKLAMREKMTGERGPGGPLNHLLEATPRDDFGVNVDPILDQNARDPFVISVTSQSAADTIRFDDPESERFAAPDRG